MKKSRRMFSLAMLVCLIVGVSTGIRECIGGKEGWEKVHCPVCGALCWKRPEDAGVVYHSKLDGACCTLCALKKGAGRL